jgi:hypothetical protein
MEFSCDSGLFNVSFGILMEGLSINYENDSRLVVGIRREYFPDMSVSRVTAV